MATKAVSRGNLKSAADFEILGVGMRYKLETDLAADVIKWLTSQNWTVFQEVAVRGAAPVDIVATAKGHVWAIECKLSLSWGVLAQALRNLPYAHFVSVAVPFARCDWEENEAKTGTLKHFRIGRIQANGAEFVTQCPLAPFNKDANAAYFLDALRPEHQTHGTAGSNRGKHWTPFKSVCEAIAIHVRDNPGCTLKDVCSLEVVKKHYRNALGSRGVIRKYIDRQVIKHVRAEQTNGKVRLYPYHPALTTEPRI